MITAKNFMLFLLLASACSQATHADEPVWQEAARYHEEAMMIARQVEQQLHVFSADSFTTVRRDSLQSFIHDLSTWKKDVVEVPGHEHEAHDHEGHDHSHTTDDITAQEMLLIQQELKNQIEKIEKRVDAWIITESAKGE